MQTLQKEIQKVEVEKGLVDLVVEETKKRKLSESGEDFRQRLEKVGLKTAGQNVERVKKMQIAYAEFTYLPQEKVDLFNQALMKETLQEDRRARSFKKLAFTDIADYDKIPPVHVISAMEKAQEKNLFDRFEVAHIQWVLEVKDPIVFGRINGCTDRFFIAQWDDDVSIEELLGVK